MPLLPATLGLFVRARRQPGLLAPGGSDDYGQLWAKHAGFQKSYARDFNSIRVNRARRALDIDERVPEATAKVCHGQNVVLFVEAEKL